MRVITIITLCLFNLTTIVAQKTITGTVSDRFDPLPYATVGIEGTSIGVLTDSQGQFSIEVSKKDKLVISYVGYKTEYIKVKKNKELIINLENESLNEVVIIGYGSSSNKSYTSNCKWPIDISTKNSNNSQQKIGNNFNTNTTGIYPNPSSNGYFNIPLSENYDKVDISVSAITGQVIFTTSYHRPNQKISIDLSRFSTGIYIVNTIANGKRLPAQKIIRS